jgi:hypothetical protein
MNAAFATIVGPVNWVGYSATQTGVLTQSVPSVPPHFHSWLVIYSTVQHVQDLGIQQQRLWVELSQLLSRQL